MANPYDRGVIVVAPEVGADFLPMAEFVQRSYPDWAVIVVREAGSYEPHWTFPGVDSVIGTGGSRLIVRDAMQQALAQHAHRHALD